MILTPTNLPIERDDKTGRYLLRYDASLHTRSNCPAYVFNKLILGTSSEGKDHKMEYGTAFHKALAHWYRGNHNVQECLTLAIQHYSQVTVPASDWRTSAHLVQCLMYYFDTYTKNGDLLVAEQVDGEWLVEKNFAYPYYRTDQTELLLCGTIDLKGTYGGRRVICDHKTTSSTVPGIFLRAAEMSPQLMMYRLLCDLLYPGQEPAVMLNGIFLGKTGKNQLQRSELVEFDMRRINNFRRWLDNTIATTVQHFEDCIQEGIEFNPDDVFIPNYTECKQDYGMCEFLPLCRLPDEPSREMIRGMNYGKRKYDPLQFQT